MFSSFCDLIASLTQQGDEEGDDAADDGAIARVAQGIHVDDVDDLPKVGKITNLNFKQIRTINFQWKFWDKNWQIVKFCEIAITK